MKTLLICTILALIAVVHAQQNSTETASDSTVTSTETNQTTPITPTPSYSSPDPSTMGLNTSTAGPDATTQTPEPSTSSTPATPTEFEVALNTSDHICLKANMLLTFNITYETNDNETKTVNLPMNDVKNIQGACKITNVFDPWFSVDFNDGDSLMMNFTTNGNKAVISSVAVSYVLSEKYFPNATKNGTVVNVENDNFNYTLSDTKKYYICKTPRSKEVDNTTSITIDSIQIQVYNMKNSSYSPDSENCDGPGPKPSPTPTPTPTPTGTPKPTTPPKPATGNWTVKDNKTDIVCVVAHVGVQFEIKYISKTGNESKNATALVNIPGDAAASGVCGNETNSFKLTFFKGWSLELLFAKEKSTTSLYATDKPEDYSIKTATLKYLPDAHFVNPDFKGEQTATAQNLTLVKAVVGGYYVCKSEVKTPLNNDVEMETYELQVQAFRSSNTTELVGNDQVCSADTDTSGIVPIVVGAALAGLVVIVVIAYIIGRRKKYSGYEAL